MGFHSNVLPNFWRELSVLPWQPNLGKNKPKLHKFQFLARNLEILSMWIWGCWIQICYLNFPQSQGSCHGNQNYARINQNSADFSSVKCYRDNVCIVRFLGSENSNMLMKMLEICKNCTYFSSVQSRETFFARRIGFSVLANPSFSGSKWHCYFNQIWTKMKNWNN